MKLPITVACCAVALLLVLHFTGHSNVDLQISSQDSSPRSPLVTSDHDGHKFIHSRYSTQFFIHHPDCACRKEVK